MPSPQSLADSVDLVLLTVPDDAIASTCAALDWRAGQAVVHCSGATELLVLAPAASGGESGGENAAPDEPEDPDLQRILR